MATTHYGKKICTKGSDIYQLGKLMVEWFEWHSPSGVEGQTLYKLEEKMCRKCLVALTIFAKFVSLVANAVARLKGVAKFKKPLDNTSKNK